MKKTLLSITLFASIGSAFAAESLESNLPQSQSVIYNAENSVVGKNINSKEFIKSNLESYFKSIETYVTEHEKSVGTQKILTPFPVLPALTNDQKKILSSQEINEYQEYIDAGLLLQNSLDYAVKSEAFFDNVNNTLETAKTAAELDVDLTQAPIFPAPPRGLNETVKNDWEAFKASADAQRETVIEVINSQVKQLKEQLQKIEAINVNLDKLKETGEPDKFIASDVTNAEVSNNSNDVAVQSVNSAINQIMKDDAVNEPMTDGKSVSEKQNMEISVPAVIDTPVNNLPEKPTSATPVANDDYFADNTFFKRDENGNLIFTPTANSASIPDFSALMEADCKLLDDNGELQSVKH